jgi:hypothetical protein
MRLDWCGVDEAEIEACGRLWGEWRGMGMDGWGGGTSLFCWDLMLHKELI